MDHLVQCLDAEVSLQCVRDTPGQHLTCVPVHDCHQVKKAAAHRRVGDVGAPLARQGAFTCLRGGPGWGDPLAARAAGRGKSCDLSPPCWHWASGRLASIPSAASNGGCATHLPNGLCSADAMSSGRRRKTSFPETAYRSGASDRGSSRSRPSVHSKMKIERSTVMRIACQLTGLGYSAQSYSASLAGLGFELSGQKLVGDGELPDLGVQVFHLLLINLWRLSTATLEYARRALKQSPLPLVMVG